MTHAERDTLATLLQETEPLLREAEAMMAAGRTPSAAHLEALGALAARCKAASSCAGRSRATARLVRRVDEVLARHALRARHVSPAHLEGMADQVVAAVQGERSGRARMTTAFLEAPSSLRRWRALALVSTACLLAGFVWLGSQPSEATRSANALRPLAEDPRSRLLDPYIPASGTASDALSPTQPASNDGSWETPNPNGWGVFRVYRIEPRGDGLRAPGEADDRHDSDALHVVPPIILRTPERPEPERN